MSKYLALFALVLSIVITEYAFSSDVIVLSKRPDTAEQLAAVTSVANAVPESNFIRMIHYNCDDTMTIMYYQKSTKKWMRIENTVDLVSPRIVAALTKQFGVNDWKQQLTASFETEVSCEGAKKMSEQRPPQMLITPQVAPVKLDEYLHAVKKWIAASPGRQFYFSLAPRCDKPAWTVYGHDADNPNGDVLLMDIVEKEEVWKFLDNAWGEHDWSGEGPEMLITAPAGLCILLPGANRL